MVKKMHTLPGHVKITAMATNGTTMTFVACLTHIHKDHIEAKHKLMQEAGWYTPVLSFPVADIWPVKAAKAQLEVGDFSAYKIWLCIKIFMMTC